MEIEISANLTGKKECYLFSSFSSISFTPTRGVHSDDRVGFGRVSFGSVLFRIGYFSDACYGGSHSGQVGWSQFG